MGAALVHAAAGEGRADVDHGSRVYVVPGQRFWCVPLVDGTLLNTPDTFTLFSCTAFQPRSAGWDALCREMCGRLPPCPCLQDSTYSHL